MSLYRGMRLVLFQVGNVKHGSKQLSSASERCSCFIGDHTLQYNVRTLSTNRYGYLDSNAGTFKDLTVDLSSYNRLLRNIPINTVLPSSFLTQSSIRLFSTNSKEDKGNVTEQKEKSDDVEESPKKVGLLKRFRNAYKEYGKALIAVHCVTSAVWLGSFYYAAVSGVDIIPMLKSIGFSDSVIDPLRKSGLGHVATAYLLYKLATPARYTVTIGGTQLGVRYMRKLGYWEPVKKEDSIRELVKEGRIQAGEKSKKISKDLKEEMKEFKDDVTVKVEGFKSGLSKRKKGENNQ